MMRPRRLLPLSALVALVACSACSAEDGGGGAEPGADAAADEATASDALHGDSTTDDASGFDEHGDESATSLDGSEAGLDVATDGADASDAATADAPDTDSIDADAPDADGVDASAPDADSVDASAPDADGAEADAPDSSSCTDGVQNGLETDVDCGGPTCPACRIAQKCVVSDDCVGHSCLVGKCRCPAGTVDAPVKGGGPYCIGGSEVSYGQYQLFYDANVSTATQSPYCAWNTSWKPAGDWPFASGALHEPVRFVNYCQAEGYCRYVGMHLCGKIGGGSVTSAELQDAQQDEWFNACSAEGANAYPYGSAYQATTCNGVDAANGGPIAWTSLMTCEGGVSALYQMSGNVAEWENGCDATTGAQDQCPVRGGSFLDGANALACGGASPLARDYQGRDVGFRCCL